MSRCTAHDRENCQDAICRQRDNLGQVGIDIQGDPTIGLGNGLGMDVTDGSITINGIDTDCQ